MNLHRLVLRSILLLVLVPTVPAWADGQQIPTPEEFFGHVMGADRELARWDKLVDYYDMIGERSNRVQVVHMGPTTLGNPFLSIFVSSPENLANLEEIKVMNEILQDPRGHSPDEIENAIENGKVVFVQSYGLHSTEVAASQSAAEIMYDFATRTDDELTEILLEGEEPDADLVRKALREMTIEGAIVPVLLGSALHNRGVPALLDASVDYLPNPLDKGAVEGFSPSGEESIAFAPQAEEPLGALVFKTVHYSTGDLTFIRVFSGTLHAGKAAFNSRLRKHERVGQIYRIHAGSRESIECAVAGQIVACVGLKKSATGDTLCAKDNQITYGSTTFANPVISMAVEPSTNADRDRLGEVLGIISREDPTFRVNTDEETGQTIMSGMGELHLEVVVHRLRDDFRLQVITGKPRVSYRQTLNRGVTINSRHVKQTGGSGQFAVAEIEFEPIEGEEFEFEDKIKGGAITAEFLKSVRKGIEDYCISGGKRAAKIQGLRATVVDGKMHDVDSSQLAFYACGVKAVRAAEEQCGLTLLEPVMRVVVTTPDDYLGAVIGDLNSRAGVIIQIGDEGQDKQVTARVPLRNLPAYATGLRSITSGRGDYSMEPDGYQVVPEDVANEIGGEES